MNENTIGLSTIYQALDPAELAHRRVVEEVVADVNKMVAANRSTVQLMLRRLNDMADVHGVVLAVIAAQLFLQMQRYQFRTEQFMSEFNEGTAEAVRDLARAFIMAGFGG